MAVVPNPELVSRFSLRKFLMTSPLPPPAITDSLTSQVEMPSAMRPPTVSTSGIAAVAIAERKISLKPSSASSAKDRLRSIIIRSPKNISENVKPTIWICRV